MSAQLHRTRSTPIIRTSMGPARSKSLRVGLHLVREATNAPTPNRAHERMG